MDLLPKSRSEFSSKDYWESFFAKREKAFEWYGEYGDICHLLDKYCKYTDKILMSGCGNSNLSEEMYNVGFRNIVNVDISDVVVKRMTAKSKGRMPYLKMDITQTTFADGEFGVVLDKGTLDAIFSHDDGDETVHATVERMFVEILRVLKVGGRYVCVTLAQDHILNKLLSFFPKSCFVRVHEVQCGREEVPVGGGGLGSRLPVFVFVCTKMKMDLPNPVLEIGFWGKEKIEKFKTTEEIKKNIEALQAFSLVKRQMESVALGEEMKVDLWTRDESLKEPRYSLFIIDTDIDKLAEHNGAFAVFIVPNGWENKDTFGSKTGRRDLAVAAGFLRLIIATLHRGHLYTSLDEVKADMSAKVMDFCPANWTSDTNIPFLSVSPDIGNRSVMYEGVSSYGAYAVENIQSEVQFYFRQLVLVGDSDRIVTKTRLMAESNKKKKSKKRVPDPKYLMQVHEKQILAGFTFLESLDLSSEGVVGSSLKVLVFGLHNMPFINYICGLFPSLHVTCVDSDLTLYRVHQEWFGLPSDDQFTFINNDIATYTKESSQNTTYDVVLISHVPPKCDKDGECGFNEDIVCALKNMLKPCGVLMRAQRQVFEHFVCCQEDMKVQQFETTGSPDCVQYFVRYDAEARTLDDVWDLAKKNARRFVDFITSSKPGFYDKTEWTPLVETIDELASFPVYVKINGHGA